MPGPFREAPLSRHLDVGSFREHGVEVRGKDKIGTRRQPGPHADHVPGFVDAHFLEPEFSEGRHHGRRLFCPPCANFSVRFLMY